MQAMLAPTPWSRFKAMFLGDKTFYRTVFALVLPVIAQNMVSNLVNLLNNVMVGAVGTTHMSGVAIANQLIFVFNLAIFGAVSGAGIYGAQFAGAKDYEGLRQSFRFKLIVSVLLTALGVFVLFVWAEPLISLYLTGEGKASDAAAMLLYGKQYLYIMLLGLLPFALSQCYSGTLRETGQPLLPMLASVVAVLISLGLGYALIFGLFGLPALGVKGAAIATVISRFAELGVVIFFSHRNTKKYPFLKGLYRSMHVGKTLAREIAGKSMPLLFNELLWSVGITVIAQIFSTRGLIVVAGINIASTVTNLFNVFFLSMGTAVAVMTGQALGANDVPLARRLVWKFLFFNVCVCIFFGGALALSAEGITKIYNSEPEVRRLAAVFMRTSAMYMAFNSVSHACYFAIRSGGKTFLTMLFDSVYTWVICVPYTYLMINYTGIGIEAVYPLCYLTEVLKCVLGLLVVRSGRWAKNIVLPESKI